jgi:PE-PPE domain/PE family
MSYVVTEPQMLATAGANLAEIGSALGEAAAAAAGSTTSIAVAADDEVSAVIAKLFSTYGQQFQGISNEVAALHEQFTLALASAAGRYANAEQDSAATLVQSALSQLPASTQPVQAATTPTTFNAYTALVMGGTGMPMPTQSYINAVNQLFIQPNQLGAIAQGLFTPEQLYPLTGVRSLFLTQSVNQGLGILDNAITQQLTAGNHLTVFGYSQSAIIGSLEIEHLMSLGSAAPSPSQLNFVFIGNEMNPNGGLLARFPGLSLASLGLDFYGSTPNNSPYSVTNYTLEYDGFADFPRYPLNVVSDLNALAGIITTHTDYSSLGQAQLNSATLLPTVGPNDKYYMIPTQNLPLLDPVRAIPVIGNPLADLVQPDLKVLVNLGYGNPDYGYSTGPADVPTPFGLFPHVSPGTILSDLAAGTQQGAQAFVADLPGALSAPITAPSFSLPFVTAAMPPPPPAVPATPGNIANALVNIVSTDAAVPLPLVDLGLTVVSLAPYDANLFFGQLSQGNLINAIGYPIAADTGMLALGGLFGYIVLAEAGISNVQQLQSLVF